MSPMELITLLDFFCSFSSLKINFCGLGSGSRFDTAYPRIGYGVLGISWSRDHARIRRIFLDGYGVLVFRIVIFKISSFKLQIGYATSETRNTATNQGVNRQGAAVQARVVKCYNSQEEGHFARQCTKPKRPRNSTWFKEKMLLTRALESGAYLDLEQLAFLTDNGDIVVPAQASMEIPTLATFQTDDLDAFDSDCDDVPLAKAVLMANLSSYDSDVLSETPFSEQSFVDNDTEIDITSDSNIISYEQYLQETENPVVQSTSSSTQQDALLMSVIEEISSQVAKCNKLQQENIVVNETLTVELERYKEQVKLLEQGQKFDLNDREKYIDGQLRHFIVDRNVKVTDFEKQIHSLKLQINATVKSHKALSTTVECLKKESKKKEDKYLEARIRRIFLMDTAYWSSE
ncbi:retrovirus-related pol polyprotein from transposon TNT 1-94 [Tanacetum coccineum]